MRTKSLKTPYFRASAAILWHAAALFYVIAGGGLSSHAAAAQAVRSQPPAPSGNVSGIERAAPIGVIHRAPVATKVTAPSNASQSATTLRASNRPSSIRQLAGGAVTCTSAIITNAISCLPTGGITCDASGAFSGTLCLHPSGEGSADCSGDTLGGAFCFAQSVPGVNITCDRTTFAGGAGNPVNCTFTDTGNGVVRMSPANLTFNAVPVGTTGGGQTALIQNKGTGPLSVTSAVATGASASKFVVTVGSCAGTYNALEQCNVLVQFAPTALGVVETANLTVTWVNALDTSTQTTSIALTGEATAGPSLPSVTITPSSLSFASQPANTVSVAQNVSLTNNGSATINVTAIAATGPFITSNTAACISSYAPSTSCTFQAQFSPIAGGMFSGSVAISLTDPATSLSATPTLGLSGIAVVPVVQTTFPRIAVSPGSLDFGEQFYGTTSAAQSVTVTNTGDAALTVGGSVRLRDFRLDLVQCQSPIVPNGSCSALVTFTPTRAGALSDVTQVSSNAVSGNATIALSGVGGGTLNGALPYNANNAGAGGKPRGEAMRPLHGCTGGTDDAFIPGCSGAFCAAYPNFCKDGKPDESCIRTPNTCQAIDKIIVTPPPPPPPPPPEDIEILPREGLPFFNPSTPSTPSDPCTGGGGNGGGSNTGPTPAFDPNFESGADDIGSDLRDIFTLSALDPINTAIGNKYHTQNDYISLVPDGVGFTRTYNSMVFATVSKNEQYFGPGWRGSWDSTLAFNADGKTATVALPGGGEYVLSKVSPFSWRDDANDGNSITARPSANNSETEWVLKTAANEQLVYDSIGRLIEATSPRNRTTKLSYTDTGFLNAVADSAGGVISFAYDAMGRVVELIDPTGGRTAYSYDEKDRLSQVRYPDGRQRGYRYEHPDFAFALTVIFDGNNSQYATFKYDAMGRATSSEFAGKVGGGTIEYASPTQSITTDAIGTKYTRDFTFIDGIAVLKKLTVSCDGCASQSSSFEYDSAGREAAIIDSRGQRREMRYNADGKLVSRTFGAGTPHAYTQTFEWHPTLPRLLGSTANGITTQLVYNAKGAIIERKVTSDGITRLVHYTYDSSGNIVQVKSNREDANDATTTEYNAQGLITKQINPLGQSESWSDFTPQGKPQLFVDQNGRNTQVRYDQRGRPITVSSLGNTTTYLYDTNGKLSTTINPDNTTTRLIYDDAHRIVGVDNSNGEKVRYTLDALSRITRTETFDPTGALAQVATQTFDGFSRLIQSVDGVGNVTRYDYDTNGNLTKTVDAQGNSAKIEYDSINRPILFIDPRGATTQSRYDAQGNLAAITDPNGNTTSYSYNGFGEPIKIQSPDAGTSTKTYNNAGLTTSTTDAKGKTTTYTYDALGRMTKVVQQNASSQISYQYDLAANGVGRLAMVTDSSGSTSYTYDENGRTASTTVVINSSNQGINASTTKTTNYIRDNLGRIRGMVYPSGKVLAMDYTQGRVTSMTLDGLPLVNDIRYFPNGGAESWEYRLANGQSKTYLREVDQAGRVHAYSLSNSVRKLTFDAASRITKITDIPTKAGTGTGTGPEQNFTYDAAGRILSFSGFTSEGNQTQSFSYDNNGNRLSSTLNGKLSVYYYEANNNRLSAVSGGIVKTNTYDATGNLTNDGAQTYVYDARGRLTGATVPANAAAPTTNYLINYQGLRVRKVSTATTAIATATNRTFIYDDGGKMLGEYDHAGNAVQELIWLGHTPVAITGTMPCLTSTTGTTAGSIGTPTCTEAATAYIFTDHLNTPREVARINAAAPTVNNGYTILWKWDSLPFGETQPNENPNNTGIFSFNHRFPGQYKDKETGLNQNWFRDYDAGLGRYVQSDPLGMRAGANTYEYVGSSPLKYSDPQGLLAVITCSPCGGGGAMSCGVAQDGASIFTFTSNTGPNPSPLNPGTYSVTAGGSSYLNISNNGTPGSVTTFDQKTGQVLNTKTNVQIHSEAITRTSHGCIIPATNSQQTSQGTVDKLVRLEAANLNSGGTLLVIRAASCGN